MEEEDTSKRRSFHGSRGEMRKKVSLHQTHELPLLQTVPAQRLDETRHLPLNWSPTALLAESECGCVFASFYMQLGAWTEILHTKMTAASVCCVTCFRHYMLANTGATLKNLTSWVNALIHCHQSGRQQHRYHFHVCTQLKLTSC